MDKFTYSDDDDDSLDRLTINVGGVKFETYITTLQNIPDTRLAWLTENVEIEILHTKEFFFDRHPGAFVHIMNYYRTGKLHTPTDICGPAFEEELQFWGIDEKQMEPCCWESFTKHREAEENLRNFEGPGFEDLRAVVDRKISTYSSSYQDRECFQFDFEKIWLILEDPHSSTFAKRFSLFSCLMIIISAFGYCLSTLPLMKRFSLFSCLMIIISVSGYCLSTLPLIKDSIYLTIIDFICLIFFTLEIIARIITTPDKKEFLKNYKNWVDFCSILPSYLSFIFAQSWVRNLVIIRILRVFRFFKLSYGLQVLVHSLKASSYELTLLLLILLIPVVIFSSLVYALEKAYDMDTKFDSVPRTFWWCIITMTTVGYGDLTPVSWPGQIVGSICSICGLLIVALPISVIGSNFSLYYAHVRARLKLPKKNRSLLQGNLRGLLRQPLSLSSRDRDRRTIKRNQNNAIRRKPNDEMSPLSLRKQMKRRKAFDQISDNTAYSDCVDVCNAETLSYNNYISDYDATEACLQSSHLGRRKAAVVVDMSDTDSAGENTDVSENTSLLKQVSPKTETKERVRNRETTSSEMDSMYGENNRNTSSSSQDNDKLGQPIQDNNNAVHSPHNVILSRSFSSRNQDYNNSKSPRIMVEQENKTEINDDNNNSDNLSNPDLNLINVVFAETLRKCMPGDVHLSQTLFSPKPMKSRSFTKDTGTPRCSRRGALALISHEDLSSSDEESVPKLVTRKRSNSVFVTRNHLDIPENSNKRIIHSDSSNDEKKRRFSMQLVTSFEDLQNGVNFDKQKSDSSSLDLSKSKFKRSQTERKTSSRGNKLTHKVKSENDINNYKPFEYNEEINIKVPNGVKESGV